jgi:hypothetical protein
MFGKKR